VKIDEFPSVLDKDEWST